MIKVNGIHFIYSFQFTAPDNSTLLAAIQDLRGEYIYHMGFVLT